MLAVTIAKILINLNPVSKELDGKVLVHDLGHYMRSGEG